VVTRTADLHANHHTSENGQYQKGYAA